MRICILGDTSGRPDEGMKKIVVNLSRELAKNHEVLTLSPFRAFSPKFWSAVRDFRPEIVHYVPGPSVFSFLISKTISLLVKPALTVVSVTLVRNPRLISKYTRLFRPSLVLTQSSLMYEMVGRTGQRVSYVPVSGVDLDRFRPVGPEEKMRLRDKYSVDKESYVILHVGHIKDGRNLRMLKCIQRSPGNQVLVVGSTSTTAEKSLVHELSGLGITIISDYCPNINELYSLADCYVFPVVSAYDSIEIPLSILEALASGIPVVSTRFGGIADISGECGENLILVEGPDYIPSIVDEVRGRPPGTWTRANMTVFSWAMTAARLAKEYEAAMRGTSHHPKPNNVDHPKTCSEDSPR